MFVYPYSVTIVWRSSKRGLKNRLIFDDVFEYPTTSVLEVLSLWAESFSLSLIDHLGKPGHLVLTIQNLRNNDKVSYSFETTNEPA